MKPFSWSFSRLKNYETCPKRYYEIDVQKNFKEDSAQLDWGNDVHQALARAIKTGAPLPDAMRPYQKWVNSLRKFQGEKLVEQKWALTKDFQPCEWFSPVAWFRGVGDFVGIAGPKALSLDWKTGKPTQDSKQLMLVAACVFAFHPDVQEVDSGYVWLKHDAMTTERYTRADMSPQWLTILPRVQKMEEATKTLTFPPQPDRLCKKYCPVSSCPFWRKGPTTDATPAVSLLAGLKRLSQEGDLPVTRAVTYDAADTKRRATAALIAADARCEGEGNADPHRLSDEAGERERRREDRLLHGGLDVC